MMYVTDAVGGRSQVAHRTGIERLAHAGAVPTTALAVITELFRDWATPLAGPALDVIYWYFREVPKLTDEVGVAEAEKQAAAAALQGRDVMSGRLAGKVCIVTGTGGSMGRATALDVRSRGCAGRRLRRGRRAGGGDARDGAAAGGEMVSLQPCRLSDPAECARLVELAVSEFGRIDVLFNLAARSHFSWLEDITDEEWDAAPQRRGRPGLLPHPRRMAASRRPAAASS